MPAPPTKHEVQHGRKIFARIPEIREVYRLWRDERCVVEIWPQPANSDGSITVRVDPPYTMDDVKTVFGSEARRVEQGGSTLWITFEKGVPIPALSDNVSVWNVGNPVAMRAFSQEQSYPRSLWHLWRRTVLECLFVTTQQGGLTCCITKDTTRLCQLSATLRHIELEYPRYVVEFLEKPCAIP